MPRKITLGSEGEEVLALQKQLSASGYGSFVQETGKFDDGTKKALILFQKANGYEEAISKKAKPYEEVFIASGPIYESGTKRVSANNEDGFFTFLGKDEENPEYAKITSADGRTKGSVPFSRIYEKIPVCDAKTWDKFRELDGSDPSYRYSIYEEMMEGMKPSNIIGKIREPFAPAVNFIGDKAMMVKGIIQDTFSSLGMVASWIQTIGGEGYNTIDEKSFRIVNLTSGNLVIALPMVPDSVSVSAHPSWDSQTPVGRTSGYHGYSYTSDRNVSFSIDLYATDFEETTMFYDMVNNISSLIYPEYENGVVKPPYCYVGLTEGLRFCGYCTNASPSYDGDLIDGIYSHVRFNLEFTATSDVPFSASDVQKDGQFGNGSEFDKYDSMN